MYFNKPTRVEYIGGLWDGRVLESGDIDSDFEISGILGSTDNGKFGGEYKQGHISTMIKIEGDGSGDCYDYGPSVDYTYKVIETYENEEEKYVALQFVKAENE